MNYPDLIKRSILMVAGAFIFASGTAIAQESYFFYHLDKKDGLYDGTIRAFAQDRFGYIWIGTMSGIYRYNSCGITAFFPDISDPHSAPASMVTSMLCDRNGDMWIATDKGLYVFSYHNGQFKPVPGSEQVYFTGLKEINGKYIAGFTRSGLAWINIYTHTFQLFGHERLTGISQRGIYDGVLHGSYFYMAADTGIICYHTALHQVTHVISMGPFPGATRLAIDKSGTLWANWDNSNGFLYRINLATEEVETIDVFEYTNEDLADQINHIYIDSKDRLWISTQYRGFILFNKEDHTFKTYKHQQVPFYPGIANNHVRNIFEDNQGNIWVGTEGYGVNYFNPDASVFHLYAPEFPDSSKEPVWCRTILIDTEGNTWMGTIQVIEILSPYGSNPRHIQNKVHQPDQLYSNSIRSMICDEKGDVWIGTARGVNCYQKKTKTIRFCGEKDSLPMSFYWAILQDSRKYIWFGSKSGLYYKDPQTEKISSIATIPALKPYHQWGVRSLYEDSQQNLWIGLNGNGLLMYNVKADTVHWFKKNWGDERGIIGNTVTSIIEDNDGYIWFSTHTGISRYSYREQQFISYNHKNGLKPIKTSGLLVDRKNRLWIGTTAGLYVLEPDRKTFSIFNTVNGLPNVEFNDQSSFCWDANQFLYPTLGGFIFFNPDEFTPDTNKVDFYLSAFHVYGKPIKLNEAVENARKISLDSDENFFSIELSAVNYKNPDQAWYAYKLDGVNKDWICTQNRNISYTNIAGGNYTFRYKATNDINNWNVPEKKLRIHVAAVFYKRPLFIILAVCLALVIIFYFILFRFRKQAQILRLESKSRLLEKEKAIAQYENLKQQLNPHMLFNTISSINSLVKIDSQVASEYLEKMSRIYRYILQNNERNLVSVEDEIGFVQNYIKLQYIRFHKGLQVSIHVSEEARMQKIVPVTLQNLIENATKHNIIDEDQPLYVTIYDEGDYLVVKNNLQKKRIVETSNKKGIHNITLLYHYFSSLPIIIEEKKEHFTIKIPLL